MIRSEVFHVVQEVFRDIFDDEELTISSGTNSQEIDEWDSLNHINLVCAIEQELNVSFALGELEDLKNVGEMIELLMCKLSVL
jgi:acyl carrier protein